MSWDPTKAECRGWFGYGTGYFMVDAKPGPVFCDTCPVRQECWKDHQARVEQDDPEGVAQLHRELDAARAAGRNTGTVAVERMKRNDPDPWIRSMLNNVTRGMEARSSL